MRTDGINKILWKYAKETVSSKEADSMFEFVSNRRDLRNGVVNKLFRILEAGDHFETPYMCNKVGRKYRLLDGNHRHQAVTRYLEKYPERKVEIAICFYEDLSPEQERAEYSKWNSGTKQNTNDFIQAYWETLPMNYFDQVKFPWGVSHKWSTEAIELKSIAGAHFAAKESKFQGIFRCSAMGFVESLQNLTMDDVKTMKAFLIEYMGVFGNPSNKSIYYKTGVFNAMYKIWFDNKDKFNPDKMKARYRKLLGHTITSMFSVKNNCLGVLEARHAFLLIMNGTRKEGPGLLVAKNEGAQMLVGTTMTDAATGVTA